MAETDNLETTTEKREYFEALLSVTCAFPENEFEKEEKQKLVKAYAELLEEAHYNDRLFQLHQQYPEYLLETTSGEETDAATSGSAQSKPQKGEKSVAKSFSNAVSGRNNDRLEFIRVKKIFDKTAILLHRNILQNSIDKANPVIAIVGIGNYLPRAGRNIFLSAKHAILYRNFDFVYENRFKLLNDIPWAIINLMTFGMSTHLFLTNATLMLGPGGIFLTTAGYAYDCLIAALRGYSEKQKIENVITRVEAQRNEFAENSDAWNYFNKKMEALEQRKQFILKEQAIKIATAFLLFAGMSLALNPLVGAPLVGAISVLVVHLVAKYYIQKYYLPKQEIRHHHDPLDLLKHKLVQYIDSEKSKIDEKHQKKNEAYQLLEKLGNQLSPNRSNGQPISADDLIEILQQLQNNEHLSAEGRSQLKQTLSPFLVTWETVDKKTQNKLKQAIRCFVEGKPIEVKPEATKDNGNALLPFFSCHERFASLDCEF